MSLREHSPATASERTPLIERDPDEHSEELDVPTRKKTRWPSLIALTVLCLTAVVALAAGFAAPAVVEEYAKEAATFRPERLSIDSFTDHGVKARIQGVLYMDATKVKRKAIRDLGRAATWVVSKVESGDTNVEVFLPGYDDVLLGRASIPPMVADIRNQHKNRVDIVADLEPGDAAGIKRVAQDYMNGLETLELRAVASVAVRSGIISLGQQIITQSLLFTRSDAPKIPSFDIEKLKVIEYGPPGHPDGIKAVAEISALNPYPVSFDVPPIAFEILLPGCEDGYLMLGTADTDIIHIVPEQTVVAGVTGFVQQLPTDLTSACPRSSKSPLDAFITAYLEGKNTTIYVRGGRQDPNATPAWIGNLLQDTIVPVPVPVHPFENMIKNFSLSKVNFQLPEPGADPTGPPANPKLSAVVNVVVSLPKDMNFDVQVRRVRADTDVFYKGQKLGELDLSKWQRSQSTRHGDEIWMQSIVQDAPLTITDEDVFTEVIQSMIFHKKGVQLSVKAQVDVDTVTALGSFIVRRIPAEGSIFIDPIGNSFENDVKEISVVDSSPETLVLQARVNVTNPTDYSAHVPFVNASLWVNNTRLGYAWGSFDVVPGANNVVMQASYENSAVGKELLSQYLSGHNVSVTVLSPHIPGVPTSHLSLDVPLPHVFGKFLKETTMHIFSSTATFVLFTPIPLFVTTIAASAFYNGTKIGAIDYDFPFSVPTGGIETPKLPVDWNNNGGFGLIRDALGGTLKLDAKADVGVKIGEWEAQVWYEAKGLGAKIRL